MRRIQLTIQVILYILETALQLHAAISHGSGLDAVPDADPKWLIMIGVILILSSASLNILSAVWIYRNMDFQGRRCGNGVCVVLHLVQMGQVWRYFKILLTNDDKDVKEFLQLRTIQATIQSFPFLLVQGSVLLSLTGPHPLLALPLIVSFVSLTFAYTCHQLHYSHGQRAQKQGNNESLVEDEQESKKQGAMKYTSWFMLYIAKTFIVNSRCLALVLFIHSFHVWVVLVLSLHSIGYSILVYILKSLERDATPKSNFQYALRAVAHICDYIFPFEKLHSSEVALFYVATSVENIILSLIWYLNDIPVPFKTVLFGCALVSLLLGLLSLYVYTRCVLHSTYYHAESEGERPGTRPKDHAGVTSAPGPDLADLRGVEKGKQHRRCDNGCQDGQAAADKQQSPARHENKSKPNGRSLSFTLALDKSGRDSREPRDSRECTNREPAQESPTGVARMNHAVSYESGINVAHSEALVDEQWRASKRHDEEGSGYFSADAFEIATLTGSIIEDINSLAPTFSSSEAPSKGDFQTLHDSGYTGGTSSNSSVSSPGRNHFLRTRYQTMPWRFASSSRPNHYPQLLETTAILSSHIPQESSISCGDSSDRDTTQTSSFAVTDSEEEKSSYCIAMGREPFQCRTLPLARTRYWQNRVQSPETPVLPQATATSLSSSQNNYVNFHYVGQQDLAVVNNRTNLTRRQHTLAQHPNPKPTLKAQATTTNLSSSQNNYANLHHAGLQELPGVNNRANLTRRQYTFAQLQHEWNSGQYESSLYSTTDMCSQSMYDLHDPRDPRAGDDSSSFCTTCDEGLEESDGSETDFTMTWPPSNLVTRHNLRILPEGEEIPRSQSIARWLEQVNKCVDTVDALTPHPPAPLAPNTSPDKACPTKHRVLGRRELRSPRMFNNRQTIQVPRNTKLKHNVPHLGKATTNLAKNALRTLCLNKKQKSTLFNPRINNETVVGLETDV